MPTPTPGAASTKSRRQYAVKHKDTGLFFAGFDKATREPLWATVDQAKVYADRFHAHAVGVCLWSQGTRAQQKSVVVAS